MKKNIIVLLLMLILSGTAAYGGGMNDDPLRSMVIVDKFEINTSDTDNPLIWDAEGWLGKDLNKLWIKTEGEYKFTDSNSEDAELQVLYSRAVAPYIGLSWTRMYGRTADYARMEGTDTNDLRFVFGIRFWFSS